MKKRIEERDPKQIIRVDGLGCFLEITRGMFEQERIVINVETHDKKSFKRINMGTFYMTFPEWLAFSNDVKLGLVKKEVITACQNNEKNKMIKSWMGGTPRAVLARAGKQRPSGLDEFRNLLITPSTISEEYCTVQMVVGDGIQKDGKLIAKAFKYSEKDKYFITRVPVAHDTLKGICCMVDMAIQAHLTAKTLQGAYAGGYKAPAPTMAEGTPETSSVSERNEKYEDSFAEDLPFNDEEIRDNYGYKVS